MGAYVRMWEASSPDWKEKQTADKQGVNIYGMKYIQGA